MTTQDLTAFKGQQFDFYVQIDHEPNDINPSSEVVESNYTYTGAVYDKPGGTSQASFTCTPSATSLLLTLSSATVAAMAQGGYWYNILQTPNDGSAPTFLMSGRFYVIQP